MVCTQHFVEYSKQCCLWQGPFGPFNPELISNEPSRSVARTGFLQGLRRLQQAWTLIFFFFVSFERTPYPVFVEKVVWSGLLDKMPDRPARLLHADYSLFCTSHKRHN